MKRCDICWEEKKEENLQDKWAQGPTFNMHISICDECMEQYSQKDMVEILNEHTERFRGRTVFREVDT